VATTDYANTRVAARRARLLGARGLRELLLRGGAPEAGGPGPAELALEASRVLGFLSGGPRRKLAALLRLEDGPTLEAVLRGLVMRLSPKRILAGAPPSPGLGPEALGTLAALPGPERAPEALAQLDSPLAPVAAAAVKASSREPRLLRLGVALQRALVESVRRELRGHGEDAALAARALGLHVDAVNAVTLLAVEAPARPDELFVQGGGLDAPGFTRLAEMAPSARRERLAAWLEIDPPALADPSRASELLAARRERWLSREARAHPFSIAPPLAYLVARAGEARRLRVVRLGLEHGLPPEALLDLVEAQP
jgi:V/A-type H+/Na+-transporting ATPase subunit C